MRGLKSTLVLIVIFAGLLGYIYYLNREGAANDSDRERVFAQISADDIEEVQITLRDGETARVQKTDGAWRLVEPVQAEADSTELSSITSSLASIDVQRVVDENAADVAQYGLEPARIQIAYKVKGEAEPRRLLLGEKTPTGGDLYARVADQKRVLLVSSFLDSTFNKTPFALRDKAILKFDRDKADGLELVKGQTSIQLTKSGSDWRLVEPIAARADFGQVESIVVRLASARMESIVEPDAKDLAKYGLDRPTATMTVSTGGSRSTLLLGRTDNALVFAKDVSRPLVFTVAPTLETDAIKEIADYRRKDLFDSRAFTANRIELRRGAETYAFEKSKNGEMEVWKNAAGQEVDTMKAEDLLTKLTSLRADSFQAAAHASLKAPVLSTTVRFDDNKTETVTFGRDGEQVYASRADEPGTALVPLVTFDEAMKALDAMK
jgi:hypothetical protein